MGKRVTSYQNHGAAAHRQAADLTVADYAYGVPNIRIGEMFKSFMRKVPLLIVLFIIGAVVAWFLTKDIKRTYQGQGTVLVQLGSEYVYEPIGTTGQQSALQLTPDHIVLNEVSILTSPEVLNRVEGEMLEKFGGERFAKDAYNKISAARSEEEQANARVDLYKIIDSSLAVSPNAKSSVINISYKHEDGEIAVAAVNSVIDSYMDYRRTVFVEGSTDIISERRGATEEQLGENDKSLQRFLNRNGISDFTSEQTGAAKRTEDLRTELDLIRGELTETEAALSTVEIQLRNMPREINLYVDDRAGQRVAQAELELKQLLSRYLPTSAPVRHKQEEIDQLRSLQQENSGQAFGGRRVGPNPQYGLLLTRRNTLQSTADSLREKEFAKQRQLEAANAKLRQMTRLMPQYQSFIREQQTLNDSLLTYTRREQEAIINQEQSQTNSENVKIISRANLPRKGRNMGLILFALACVGWAFTLVTFTMIAVFLDPKLYVAPPYLGADRRMTGDEPAIAPDRGDQWGEEQLSPNIPEAIPEPVLDPAYKPVPVPDPVPVQAPLPVHNSMTQPYVPQPAQMNAEAAQPHIAQAGGVAPYPVQQPVYNVAGANAYDVAQPVQANPYLQAQDVGDLKPIFEIKPKY